MDAKEVVENARQHFNDLFGGEVISDVGLEEVNFDHESDTWEITIGFRRLSDSAATLLNARESLAKRYYKTISIDYESGIFQGVERPLYDGLFPDSRKLASDPFRVFR